MNYAKEKLCAYCGKTFVAKSPTTLYCSHDCYNATRRKSYRFRESKEELEEIRRAGESYTPKPKKKKKSGKTIAEVCREAREYGMSYGQYVARYGV